MRACTNIKGSEIGCSQERSSISWQNVGDELKAHMPISLHKNGYDIMI